MNLYSFMLRKLGFILIYYQILLTLRKLKTNKLQCFCFFFLLGFLVYHASWKELLTIETQSRELDSMRGKIINTELYLTKVTCNFRWWWCGAIVFQRMHFTSTRMAFGDNHFLCIFHLL